MAEIFFEETHYVVTAGSDILFIAKSEEELNKYFLNPSTCSFHENTLFTCTFNEENIDIANHTKCWKDRGLSKKDFTTINLVNDQTKYFLSSSEYTDFQFGHIMLQYYFPLFYIIDRILKNHSNLNEAGIIMLGSERHGYFSPDLPYYKKFTEKVFDINNIKNYTYSKNPKIFKINKFWYTYATIGQGLDLHKFLDKILPTKVTPYRKVYATKSKYFGKLPHIYRNSLDKVKSAGVEEVFMSDKNFSSPYEAFKSYNILAKRIYNETVLEKFLESMGFECIEPAFKFHKPECLYISLPEPGGTWNVESVVTRVKCVGGCSVEDAISYFREVKVLAAISSSALANLFFMNEENTSIVEFKTKFFLTNGDRYLPETLYKKSTSGNEKEFNDFFNHGMKERGVYHTWHKEQADLMKIKYYEIKNDDLNAETLVSKIKNNPEIMNILSQ